MKTLKIVQWVDGYKIQNGHSGVNNGTQEQMLTNAVVKAAVAARNVYNLQIDNFTFTPGLRYETSVYPS
jgi:Fe(3+) dicitrate transport protein